MGTAHLVHLHGHNPTRQWHLWWRKGWWRRRAWICWSLRDCLDGCIDCHFEFEITRWYHLLLPGETLCCTRKYSPPLLGWTRSYFFTVGVCLGLLLASSSAVLNHLPTCADGRRSVPGDFYSPSHDSYGGLCLGNIRIYAVSWKLPTWEKKSPGGLPHVPLLLSNQLDGHFSLQLRGFLQLFLIVVWFCCDAEKEENH